MGLNNSPCFVYLQGLERERVVRPAALVINNVYMGKLGNIVAETLCFPSMFPCLPTSGKIVAETKFASQEAKMFPKEFRNIFVAETMFPSLPTCFQVFPARKTLFSRLSMLK